MKYVRTFVIAQLGIICIFRLAITAGKTNFWLAGILFLLVLIGARSLLNELSKMHEKLFHYATGKTVGLTKANLLIS
jgi:hypothetical protein